jgi:hypothetical protein
MKMGRPGPICRRFIAKFSLCLSLIAIGCGRSEPAPRETPEQAADRVFVLAQDLEKEHKTKEAFAAYRQIIRLYPGTPGGKKAADRVAQAQKSAIVRKHK